MIMLKRIIQSFNSNEILKASLLLSLITVLVKLAGYIEKVLLAYFWGTSDKADCYNAVFALIISIFVFFREIVEPGFLNNFLKMRINTDEKEAWNVFFTVFWCILPAGIIVSFCLYLFPDAVTHITLPGFSNERFRLAATLLRIASPACVFLIISALTYITLNAYKKFTIAATGDLALKLVIVLFIIIFARRVGIQAAIYGLVTGAIVKLIIHITALRKNISWGNSGLKRTHLNNIWALTWPLMIGILFSQINNLTDNIFASYLKEGSISALSYSKKLVELPVILFPYALSVVVFPYFSELHIEKNIVRLRHLLRETLKWIAIVFIPLSICLFLFSETVTQLVFQHGAFDSQSTALTAGSLAIYSIGLPAFAIETVLVIFYFSVADTKTPIFTGILCVIVNIVVTWVLVDHFAHLGIALGLVISKTLKVVILLYLLKYKFKPEIIKS